MSKTLLVVAVLAFGLNAPQNQNAVNQAASEKEHNEGGVRIVVNENEQPHSQSQETADKPNGWHKLISWPEGITAWAVILTLGAIVWQAFETRRSVNAARDAAKASLLNARAIVDSERAWVEVTVKSGTTLPQTIPANQLAIWAFFPTVTNSGRTVCRLTGMFIGKRFARSPQELPAIPNYSEAGASILNAELLLFPDSPQSPLDIKLSMEEVWRVRNSQDSLYIYGYVQYEIPMDSRNPQRQTRFIFVYNIPAGFSALPEGFLVPVGLPEYNRAT